jgi:hypothetical protein
VRGQLDREVLRQRVPGRPVYAKVLRETFVAPIRDDEAAVIADALSRR